MLSVYFQFFSLFVVPPFASLAVHYSFFFLIALPSSAFALLLSIVSDFKRLSPRYTVIV